MSAENKSSIISICIININFSAGGDVCLHLITFGSTRGSEDREEKEAVREAFELREAFEFREAFELAVSEDFLCGTDGVNCSLERFHYHRPDRTCHAVSKRS